MFISQERVVGHYGAHSDWPITGSDHTPDCTQWVQPGVRPDPVRANPSAPHKWPIHLIKLSQLL